MAIQMTLESDGMMLLLAAGIVIYIEESRQTKVDPFLWSRDLGFYMAGLILVAIGLLLDYNAIIPAVLLALSVVFLLFQHSNNYLQYQFYNTFGLI